MAKLEGKVAVVTGASAGIGAAIAEKLADSGASVVVNYGRNRAGAENVVGRIQKKGGKAVAVQADVSRPADAQNLINQAEQSFGKVDILVNNAGIYELKPLEQIDEEHFDKQFQLNVRGLLFVTREAVGRFNGDGGSIVNISSVVSESPVAGAAVYSATKGAVDAITKALAQELGGRKIRVNSIAPGPVATEGFRASGIGDTIAETSIPRTPLGRLGQVDDVADAVAFLASDDARWITGEVIRTAGGLRL